MKNPSIRSIIVIIIFVLIVYSIIDGIREGNTLGIALAIGSLGALGFCILLFNRLRSLKDQEEEDKEENLK